MAELESMHAPSWENLDKDLAELDQVIDDLEDASRTVRDQLDEAVVGIETLMDQLEAINELLAEAESGPYAVASQDYAELEQAVSQLLVNLQDLPTRLRLPDVEQARRLLEHSPLSAPDFGEVLNSEDSLVNGLLQQVQQATQEVLHELRPDALSHQSDTEDAVQQVEPPAGEPEDTPPESSDQIHQSDTATGEYDARDSDDNSSEAQSLNEHEACAEDAALDQHETCGDHQSLDGQVPLAEEEQTEDPTAQVYEHRDEEDPPGSDDVAPEAAWPHSESARDAPPGRVRPALPSPEMRLVGPSFDDDFFGSDLPAGSDEARLQEPAEEPGAEVPSDPWQPSETADVRPDLEDQDEVEVEVETGQVPLSQDMEEPRLDVEQDRLHDEVDGGAGVDEASGVGATDEHPENQDSPLQTSDEGFQPQAGDLEDAPSLETDPAHDLDHDANAGDSSADFLNEPQTETTQPASETFAPDDRPSEPNELDAASAWREPGELSPPSSPAESCEAEQSGNDSLQATDDPFGSDVFEGDFEEVAIQGPTSRGEHGAVPATWNAEGDDPSQDEPRESPGEDAHAHDGWDGEQANQCESSIDDPPSQSEAHAIDTIEDRHDEAPASVELPAELPTELPTEASLPESPEAPEPAEGKANSDSNAVAETVNIEEIAANDPDAESAPSWEPEPSGSDSQQEGDALAESDEILLDEAALLDDAAMDEEIADFWCDEERQDVEIAGTWDRTHEDLSLPQAESNQDECFDNEYQGGALQIADESAVEAIPAADPAADESAGEGSPTADPPAGHSDAAPPQSPASSAVSNPSHGSSLWEPKPRAVLRPAKAGSDQRETSPAKEEPSSAVFSRAEVERAAGLGRPPALQNDFIPEGPAPGPVAGSLGDFGEEDDLWNFDNFEEVPIEETRPSEPRPQIPRRLQRPAAQRRTRGRERGRRRGR